MERISARRSVNPATTASRAAGWFTAVFFFALAAVAWIATRGPGVMLDLFENGHWLAPASDMLAGKVPYRDTFPMHGFLSDGGRDFLVFQVFGPSFRASVEARHVLESFFHPALFLVAAAASRRPVLAGFLGAAGLLYALEFGTFVLATQAVTLVACRVVSRKTGPCPFRARGYFAGLAAVFVPWLGLLASHGALWQFLKVSFLDLPTRFESLWGLHFPAPWELVREWLRGHPYMAGGVPVGPAIAKRFYLAPVLGATGVVFALVMRKRGTSSALAMRLFALSLACLAFLRYVIFRFHLPAGNALTGPVFFLLLVAAFETFRTRVASPRRLAAVLAAVGVLAAFAMNGPSRLFSVFREATRYRERTTPLAWTVPLTLPRGGGIRVPRDEERNLRTLIEFTDRHAPPGAAVLDLTNRAALYFFLRRTNPTRFAEVIPMAPFEDEVLRDLRNGPPALVFLETGTWLDAIDGIPNSRRIPRVWSWVLENYPVRVKVGDTTVALPPR